MNVVYRRENLDIVKNLSTIRMIMSTQGMSKRSKERKFRAESSSFGLLNGLGGEDDPAVFERECAGLHKTQRVTFQSSKFQSTRFKVVVSIGGKSVLSENGIPILTVFSVLKGNQ
ncbi:hypothetical protein TNCV_4016131 [Trichonephila clavipes]|nr:hypothetical protein TNCV_4016131 [Trichonephila clavipes]